jgi:hypothetical protein
MKTPEQQPEMQETKYGYYKPLETFRITDLGGIFRDYEYKSKANGEINYDSIYCKDKKDKSPVYLGYDPEFCHNCFAGYAHSTEKHNSTVQQTKKS